MVTLRERPVGGSSAGEGSGLGSGAEQLEERMRELISVEVMRSILDQTPMIFGMVKEGILEILHERLGAFRTEMMALLGVRTLTFREFRACGAPDYHGARDPVASSRWLADVANAFSYEQVSRGGQGQTRFLSSEGQSEGLVGGDWSCFGG